MGGGLAPPQVPVMEQLLEDALYTPCYNRSAGSTCFKGASAKKGPFGSTAKPAFQ